ncbi:hypothetical protein KR222_005914, partial [Zaprionus bogoriensis]
FSFAARNGESPQDDAELIPVPHRQTEATTDPDFKDFKGVIDTGSGYPFLQPNPSTFKLNLGFFDSFDDIFRRLHTRLWPFSAGSDEAETGSGDSSEVGSPLGFGLRTLTPLNTQNGNTTSTVKVVDGHKVEINETTYGDANSLFKVRLVNVRPLESGEEILEGVTNNQGDFKPVSSPSTSAPPKRSELDESDEVDAGRREPLEKQPKDNEVRDIDEPQQQQQQQQQVEVELLVGQQLVSAQDAGTMAHNEEAEMPLPDSDSHNAADEQLQMLQQQAIETESELVEPQPEELQQELQAYREREELESSDDEEHQGAAPVQMSDAFNDEWADLEGDADAEAQPDPGNDLNNHIDIYESFAPVDLSNDIAVNDVAAANPDYPYNPDAEVFEVPQAAATMPKFEKLSLTPAS